MKYYIVIKGKAIAIEHDKLKGYPYIIDDAKYEADDDPGTRYLYETAGIDWIIAYAETPEEAIKLATKYDNDEIEKVNIWCEICGTAHGALANKGEKK